MNLQFSVDRLLELRTTAIYWDCHRRLSENSGSIDHIDIAEGDHAEAPTAECDASVCHGGFYLCDHCVAVGASTIRCS